MGGFAWVTLATNDSYSLGALVLAHSLRRVNTAHQLAVLITPGVTPSMREKLGAVFDSVTEVNVLDSRDAANLALLARPDLGITFTKLHCWRLTQYEKCCFLDADTLVIQNCDELSEREELSAAPDVGWPDCFNSGVFVYRPSLDTFKSLMDFALQFGSFDGGDQGLLNLYFKDWAHKDISKHLPFIYNMCSTACYSYLPAFKQFGSNAKIVHFIGASKPWICYLDSESRVVQAPGEFSHVKDLLQYWWDVFCQDVHSNLSPAMHVDYSFFQSPHSHPAHHELGPTLPSHNPTSNMFVDPWESYIERYQQEVQMQKQKEDWLAILSKDERQRGCETPQNDSTEVFEEHYWKSNDSASNTNFQNQSNEGHPSSSYHHESDHGASSWSNPNYELVERPPEGGHLVVNENPAPAPPHSPPPIHNNDHGSQGQVDNNDSAGLAGALANLTLGAPRSAEQTALEDQWRRQAWEQGHIDYMGRDSFDNIWKRPQPSPEALKVDPSPPGTPPVGAPQEAQGSEPLDPNAPVPPKRKGSGPAKGKK
ncbi:Glycogenin-1 [Frankliniella fusca]|uniref:glycogenin glucosyltransferase n=1 Tax=Frankliniella fusca TaxID=407009 RepID=A0AAE1HGJ4_9NEOP|nr:Glycogenin-1 [Frankliniella fusca]